MWLVHGTTFRNDEPNAGPNHWSEDFRLEIGEFFGQNVNVPDWAGGNSRGDRLSGAEELVAQIRSAHLVNPNEPIRIVGYSHGVNVAISAINMLADQCGIHVDTLITIGTPSRNQYRLNVNVGQHLNVFNSRDEVQIIGGTDFPWQDDRGFWSGLRDNFIGFGGRTQPGANNIEVFTGVGGFWDLRAYFDHNHSFMHSNWEIWEQYIIEHLRINETSSSRGGILSLLNFVLNRALESLLFTDRTECD